jgi:FkbM family methyltransferase
MKAAIARTKHGLFQYFPNDKWCGRSLELYGEWSDAEAGLIEQLVGKGATIVEVGAHLGAHTVPAAKHVGAGGRVIAFEPQAPIFALLEENLRANGAAWVDARRQAVGSRAGKANLPAIDYDAAEGNFGGCTLLEHARGAHVAGAGAGELVDVVTIDGLRLDRLDLLKADVEGFEAEVLRGARETIERCRPILYLENDHDERSAELIRLVMDLGYRLWWHLPPLYRPDNFRGCGTNVFRGIVSVNMLCVPAERPVRMPYLREILDPAAQWVEATKPRCLERCAPVAGQKTAAVLVSYAYGDAILASSVLPGLREQGYHVTVYCDGAGEEILRGDPNVDRMLWQPRQENTLGDIADWFVSDRAKYDRAVNLMEVLARNSIAWGPDVRFVWPDAARRAIFSWNYDELAHLVADVPHVPAQRFYPSAEEIAWARSMRVFSKRPVAVLSGAGSTAPKFWPYLEELAVALIEAGFEVWILGDLRGQTFAEREHLHAIGTAWPIRQAMTWAQGADLVIGQETGLLNAVALEQMAKIVLLSHSTPTNLTKHWTNTAALHGRPACWPCHRLHSTFEYCHRDESTGAALCQAEISVDDVFEAIPLQLKTRALKALGVDVPEVA